MKSNNAAWCFDQKDENGNFIDLSVYGASELEPHRRVDLSFIPCKPVISINSNDVCSIPDNRSESYAAKL